MRETTHLEGGRTTVNKADVMDNQVPIYMQVGDILDGHAVHKFIERISIH